MLSVLCLFLLLMLFWFGVFFAQLQSKVACLAAKAEYSEIYDSMF